MYLIKVLLEYKNINLDRTFDYYIEQEIPLYTRVLVEFNKKNIIGFVIEINDFKELDYEVKPVLKVIDQQPLINQDLYDLALFMQEKYLCSRIQALQTILPSGLKPASTNKVSQNFELYVSLTPSNEPLNEKQQEAYNKLKSIINEQEKYAVVLKQSSVHMINVLIKKGYLIKTKQVKQHVLVDKNLDEFKKLNTYQQAIYQEIIDSKDQTFLLHGITGSGKTEIYLHLAQYYLDKQQTVLVLVPEITLSVLMQSHFGSRFENKIAILHSRLTSAQKYQEYQKIINNEVSIVVGTRSSIFAPLTNIGLIIIDEEHDSSFKQTSGIMYHTNDIASARINKSKAKLVLASASPSLISLTRAYQKKYHYLTLNKRYSNQALPKIDLVDLNYEQINNVVSTKVMKSIKDYLALDKQVIVLLNRRGYHNMFQCRSCQEIQMCKHCNVALVYHHASKSLRCHHCGYSTTDINHCEYCHSTDIKRLGFGIQRVEEYLTRELESYKVIRIDQDTIKSVKSLEDKLTSFKQKKANVLIGTQMIAKGLDFDSADLVVVLNIDASLAFNSYDALESAFMLLVQVSGRSGRHSGQGRVLIETYQPSHYVIQKAVNNDYLGFYEQEMAQRKKYDNPPYYKIALLLISSYDEVKALKEADSLYKYLKDSLKNVIIKNNMEHPIYKLANMYRLQIVIKYKNINDIKEEMLRVKKTYANKQNINLVIDLEY